MKSFTYYMTLRIIAAAVAAYFIWPILFSTTDPKGVLFFELEDEWTRLPMFVIFSCPIWLCLFVLPIGVAIADAASTKAINYITKD